MMRKHFSLVCLLSVAVTAPVAAAPVGTITGTLLKAPAGLAVTAIDRQSGKMYSGRLDNKSGQYRVTGLPLGKSYDLRIGHGDAWLEGVSLAVPHSDYEEEQPLAMGDTTKLTDLVHSLNKFENKLEVLAIHGNIQHAAVLVNKLRTTPFINSAPGEMIWRLELWHFERPDDTWIKVQDELFIVLHRERLQKTAFGKMSLTLDEHLGGLKPTLARPSVDMGRIKWPAAKPGIRLRR